MKSYNESNIGLGPREYRRLAADDDAPGWDFMLKRLVCAVLALFLLGAAASAEEAMTLAFWTDSRARADEMRAAALLWNEGHPDRTIALSVTQFDADIIDDRMWTAMHSGVLMPGLQQPDIADIEYARFPRYVNPQIWLLCPLSRWLGAQPGTAYAAFTYGSLCMGIPVGSGEMAVIYSARALKEAGVDVSGIRTWDDFISAGRRYRRETGNPFLAVDMDSYLVFLTIYQQLSKDNSDGEAVYAQTLSFLTSLFDANIACIMPGGRADSRAFREAFESGAAPCAFVRLEDADGYDALVGPVPAMGEETGVWIPSRALCVTTFCDDIDLAASFIEFAAGTVREPPQGVLFPGNTEGTLDYIQNYKLELAKMILR